MRRSIIGCIFRWPWLAVLAAIGGKAICDRFLPESSAGRRHAEPSWWDTPKVIVPVVALTAISLALGFATIDRNRDYRSKVAIWQDTVQKRPENARAPYSLGLALDDEATDRGGCRRLPGVRWRSIPIMPKHTSIWRWSCWYWARPIWRSSKRERIWKRRWQSIPKMSTLITTLGPY